MSAKKVKRIFWGVGTGNERERRGNGEQVETGEGNKCQGEISVTETKGLFRSLPNSHNLCVYFMIIEFFL